MQTSLKKRIVSIYDSEVYIPLYTFHVSQICSNYTVKIMSTFNNFRLCQVIHCKYMGLGTLKQSQTDHLGFLISLQL